MKKSFFVLKTEFAQVLRQTKILLLLFFIIMLYETILSPVRTVCADTQFSLQPFEPFILICTRSTNIILVPLIYMVLLGGFPYCKTMYFQIVRTGKRQWFWGEFAFIALSALALTFILFIASDLFLLDCIKYSNGWSDFMKITRSNFPEIYSKNGLLFLDASIVAHGSPGRVMLYTFGMMWLYLIVTGVCVLLGTIIGKRFWTILIGMAMTVIGGLAIYFNAALRWLFPLVHVEYGLHYNSLFSQTYFPVWGSIAYYLLLTAALVVFGLYRLKRMNVGDEI